MQENSQGRIGPPIFIGGTGRSGTTVLIRLMSRCPDIHAIKWESQFIVAKNGLLDLAYGSGPDETRYEKFRQRMDGHWYKRTVNHGKPNEYSAGLCFDVEAHSLQKMYGSIENRINSGQELADSKFLRGLIGTLFVPAVRRASATRWCEKTPSNILKIPELYKLYPNMKFINIVRDGRDVVSSLLKKQIWPVAANKDFPSTLGFHGKQEPELTARYWETILRIGDGLAAQIPHTNYYELKLEDLVGQPQKTIKSLFTFLGHEVNADILKYDLSKSNMGRWKDDLLGEDLKKVEAIIKPMMRYKGYI